MKWVIVLLICFLFTGCAGKEELKAYYKAANQPMVSIKLPAPGGGEYEIVTRRPNIPQYESQWVKGLREVGSVIKSPVGGIVAVGTAVLPNAGGNRSVDIGGDNVGHDSKVTHPTEVVPMGGE